MNEHTRQLVIAWMDRAENESDPFIKFFILYMCMDAWTTSESTLDSDSERIAWLIGTENSLRSCWLQITDTKLYVDRLVAIGKVEDMRPGKRGKYKYLRDPDNFKQLVRFIHQVRCNLFHGGKSPNNSHDRELVTLAGGLLLVWLKRALLFTEK